VALESFRFTMKFLVGTLVFMAGLPSVRCANGVRDSIPLNDDWKFKRQAAPGPAQEPEFVSAEQSGYADRSWQVVSLPHTWDVTAENPFTVPQHFRGIGWYRRSVRIPDSWKSRRVSIRFKGVFQVTDLWINGTYVGKHVGGYTGFQFDITEHLRWNGSNTIAVRVNDVLTPDIAPANETNVPGYGGIYRVVSLVAASPVHISPDATRVTTEQAGGSVVIHVRTRIKNSDAASHSVQVRQSAVDAQGVSIGAVDRTATLSPGEEKEFTEQLRPVANAHLWSPDSPYLYRLVTTVSSDGQSADEEAVSFGIRFMSNDAAHGFLLNGKPINLHGVNRRQDYGFLGDAVPEAIGRRDIRIIKDMGANFIRTSHYPQDPAILDECDRLGILVWEEVPNIKTYLYPPSGDRTQPTETERFPRAYIANVKQQLGEMIDRDYNHPSIVIWGFADDLSLYHYPEDLRELSDYVHSLDATRWTAGREPHMTDIMDATTGDLLRRHNEHPERRYIWNEWGAFASERSREGAPFYAKLPADPGSEVSMADSAEALLLEGYWMQWAALPWLGTAKWCMFDTGEVNAVQTQSLWTRNRDAKVNLRWPFNDYYGLADMWRLPKEGYYFLQSQWTEKPMVHIVGHWTSSAGSGEKRTVRVYSNADSVELILNGRSLGAHESASPARIWKEFHSFFDQFGVPDEFSQELLPGAALKHGPFIWDDVPYEPGTLAAVATKSGATLRHELHTPQAPTRILLRAEKATLSVPDDDVTFIEADVVDAAGTVVPDARPWLHFEVKGAGRLLGGVADIDAITGVAAINVGAVGDHGEIEVAAASSGLQSGLVRIQVRKVGP
jgi:beta-galactosidase